MYGIIHQNITKNVFSGPSTPTALPPRNRVLTLSVVDRPSGDLAEILTVMPPGRPFFLLVTFDYGLPFNGELQIVLLIRVFDVV